MYFRNLRFVAKCDVKFVIKFVVKFDKKINVKFYAKFVFCYTYLGQCYVVSLTCVIWIWSHLPVSFGFGLFYLCHLDVVSLTCVICLLFHLPVSVVCSLTCSGAQLGGEGGGGDPSPALKSLKKYVPS